MRIFVSISAWFVIMFVFHIPLPGLMGYYNPMTQTFWCTDELSCLHEQAHYIDWTNGKPSRSEEYKLALVLHVFVEQDDLAKQIVGWAGMPIHELYAMIYAYMGGDVPDSLKSFYPQPNVVFRSVPYFNGEFYYAVPDADN